MANPRIQLRHDTSANWSSANPTLLEGEFAYETDTKKIKVGDGTTAYNSLAYLDVSLAKVDDLTVHGLLSSFAGNTTKDTNVATATFGPASSSYKYETFLEHDAFHSTIFLGERQGVPSADGTYVQTPDSALVLRYELSGSDRGLYMVDDADYKDNLGTNNNIYKIITEKDVDLSAINNVQEKLVAGRGITINQYNNTISVNTNDNAYRVSIDNPQGNSAISQNKLYNYNNLAEVSPSGQACGCNINIPMDDFTQIEFVQVCEKLGPVSNEDIVMILLGDNYYGDDSIGRLWVDHWWGSWRMVIIPKNGQEGGTQSFDLSFASTAPGQGDRFDIKFVITPTNIKCYTRVNPSSDEDDWYQSVSKDITVNSTTMNFNSPYKNVYIGGNDFVYTGKCNLAAGTYDLTKCYLKVDDTTYNMMLGTETIVATSSQLGLVKPDGTTITIDKYGTISSISSTPDNLVTLDTQQTISGEKTFSSSIHINNDIVTGDGHRIANGSQAGLVTIGDSNASLALYSNNNVTINSDTIYTDGMNDGLCHLAMPDPTKNITLSFSGTQQDYTVPSDGYFMANGTPSTTGGQLWIVCTGNGLASQLTGNQGIWVAGYVPCRKNDVIKVNVAGFNISNIRFTPCVGSVIEEG